MRTFHILFVVALWVAAPAFPQDVVVDVQCDHTETATGYRVVCRDNLGRSTTAPSPDAVAASTREALTARCGAAERGESGYGIADCPPTVRICELAAMERRVIAGCPGSTLEVSTTNHLLLRRGTRLPKLVVACNAGQLAATIWPFTELEGKGTRVSGRVRWDESPAETVEWARGASPSGHHLTALDPVAFVAALEARLRLAVELQPEDMPPSTVYFHVGGTVLQERLPYLRSSCRGTP